MNELPGTSTNAMSMELSSSVPTRRSSTGPVSRTGGFITAANSLTKTRQPCGCTWSCQAFRERSCVHVPTTLVQQRDEGRLGVGMGFDRKRALEGSLGGIELSQGPVPLASLRSNPASRPSRSSCDVSRCTSARRAVCSKGSRLSDVPSPQAHSKSDAIVTATDSNRFFVAFLRA